jgi:hypothetical protein
VSFRFDGLVGSLRWIQLDRSVQRRGGRKRRNDQRIRLRRRRHFCIDDATKLAGNYTKIFILPYSPLRASIKSLKAKNSPEWLPRWWSSLAMRFCHGG